MDFKGEGLFATRGCQGEGSLNPLETIQTNPHPDTLVTEAHFKLKFQSNPPKRPPKRLRHTKSPPKSRCRAYAGD